MAYAALIKRESGYDPEHGDWEYSYANLKGDKHVERGRLETCIRCHASAAPRDYLFKTYLQPSAD